MKTYEAMFLLDAGNPDFEAASQPVRQLLDRIKAEVLVFKLWDERRLAYEIKGRKRGLYVLIYFKADPLEIRNIEHDIQISEIIVRAQILQADHVTAEQMNAPTPHEQGGVHHWEDRRDEVPVAAPGVAAPGAAAPAEAPVAVAEEPQAPGKQATE